MLKLTIPKAEVSLHIQQADQELTLEFLNGDSWKLRILDTSGIPNAEMYEINTVISLKECASLLFLWANCDCDNEGVDVHYEMLKPLLSRLPPNLRPIP